MWIGSIMAMMGIGMTARIVDLAKWREEHPPLLRLLMAHQRCVTAWWSLFFTWPMRCWKRKY